jgi:hypothetical protein
MRVLRSDLLTTLKEDFILLARAKGLPQWRVLLQHALRPLVFYPDHNSRPQHRRAHRWRGDRGADLRPAPASGGCCWAASSIAT